MRENPHVRFDERGLETGGNSPRQLSTLLMSLIQSAKLNGLEPLAYLTDVLTRLPTHPNRRIGELLPHRWNAESEAGQ